MKNILSIISTVVLMLLVSSHVFSQENGNSQGTSQMTGDNLDCFDEIATCPMLESKTKYNPEPRSRTTVGIGEEVTIELKNNRRNKCGKPVWNVTGNAILISSTDEQAKIKMKYMAGQAVVKVSLSGGLKCHYDCDNLELSIEYVVIVPANVYMEKTTTPITSESGMHEQYRVSCGFYSKVFIGPDNVNFYNVSFQEDNALSDNTGSYHQVIPTPVINHIPTLPVSGTTTVVSGKGTLLQNEDIVEAKLYCRSIVDPTLQGTMTFDIIQYYFEPGTTTLFPFDLTAQKHINYGGTNSKFESIKTSAQLGISASHYFYLNDPTTIFQLDPLMGCQ